MLKDFSARGGGGGGGEAEKSCFLMYRIRTNGMILKTLKVSKAPLTKSPMSMDSSSSRTQSKYSTPFFVELLVPFTKQLQAK